MRPNISEQLDGLRRILAEVVAPDVQDPYPADILAGVIASLDGIGRAWYEVPLYLHWDSEATAEILASALPVFPRHLAAAVHAAAGGDLAVRAAAGGDLAAPQATPFDLGALEQRHQRMRAALALAVPAILADPELAPVRTRMVQLFRERAQRFPLALSARPATPRPAVDKPDGDNEC
jgi:hypothetical protein